MGKIEFFYRTIYVSYTTEVKVPYFSAFTKLLPSIVAVTSMLQAFGAITGW